jgi:hypothetical protein
VRARTLISALLILALFASASACVAGTSDYSTAGGRARFRPCRSEFAHRQTNSSYALRAPITRCALRGLLSFQFLTLPAFEVAVPLELTAQEVTEPSDSTVELTSIGSPETDRGPPRS